MAERYTKADVISRFEALAKTAKEIGLDVSGWELLPKGSLEAMTTYRLRDKRNDYKGVLYLSHGYLGTTAREAYNTLDVMNNVLWALREAGKL